MNREEKTTVVTLMKWKSKRLLFALGNWWSSQIRFYMYMKVRCHFDDILSDHLIEPAEAERR